MTKDSIENRRTRYCARAWWTFCGPAAALLVLSTVACISPVFMDRANDPPGWSGGIAAEGAEAYKPMIVDDWTDEVETFIAPVGIVRCRTSEYFTHELALGYGLNLAWLNASSVPDVDTLFTGGIADIRLSEKIRVLEHGAVKLTLGALLSSNFGLYRERRYLFADVRYLHDFGDYVTGSLGIGYPPHVSLGVVFRPSISEGSNVVVALQSTNLTGIGIGLGLDWSEAEPLLEW